LEEQHTVNWPEQETIWIVRRRKVSEAPVETSYGGLGEICQSPD